ncbi:tyrosine-type recombinase/integrase [Nitrosomonas sp. ANs5]|uniref:tyrosine-type recombinase/integrase n=1 Tax=Nitrosomonas sp. ANs5 TaxID=3423941 RepID=UPI003D34B7D1
MSRLQKLTLDQIKNTPAKAKQYGISDGGGLTLLILPTGLKYWRFRYRFKGKATMISLGRLADPVTKSHLTEVRRKHQEKVNLLARGINPAHKEKPVESAIKEAPAPLSFEAVAHEWWKKWSKNKNVRHTQQTMYRLQKRAFPLIGHMPITEVRRPHIIEALQACERDSRLQARRLWDDVRNVFRHAYIKEYIPASPLLDVKPADLLIYEKKPDVTNFPRVGAEQLPELMRAIKGLDSFFVKRGLLLLALTATRTGELIGAKWEEIDFNEKLWEIPAARTKKSRTHLVPLSTQALSILSELHEFKISEYIFPNSRDRSRHMAHCSMLAALYRLDYKGIMTAHGFRGIFSTMAHDSLLFPHQVIQKALSHLLGNSTDRSYDESEYLEERRKLLQWWANQLDTKSSG